jgi:beta-glucanase (GH16 family)
VGLEVSSSLRARRTIAGCAAVGALVTGLLLPDASASEHRAAAAASSWRDDFDRLDPGTWNVIDRDCFDPANVAVSGGKLRMTIARSSRPDCPGVTGARINTYGLRQFQSGAFTARIKFVLAPGSWQTFWLTGASDREFPANGEVDIAEIIGRTPDNTHVALHSAFKSGGSRRCDVGGAPAATLDRVWHVYGVTTGARGVTFTIDGKAIASYRPGSVCTWPFGDPMRMLFSSRGGQYGGVVVPAAYPITYLVDWVSWHAAA